MPSDKNLWKPQHSPNSPLFNSVGRICCSARAQKQQLELLTTGSLVEYDVLLSTRINGIARYKSLTLGQLMDNEWWISVCCKCYPNIWTSDTTLCFNRSLTVIGSYEYVVPLWCLDVLLMWSGCGITKNSGLLYSQKSPNFNRFYKCDS